MESSLLRLGRRLALGVILPLGLATAGMRAAAGDASRVILSLDENWRFHLGAAADATAPAYDDSAWRRVDVPHDYVVEGRVEPTTRFTDPDRPADWHILHGFLPVQPAVYRRSFTLPAEANGRRLWLEFDGVFSNSRYWLNGREIGAQYSGYTRSRFDITDAAIRGGRNVLVVAVDPRYDGWWYEGGGIYRHVRLVVVDPVHLSPDGVFVAPSVSDPGNGERADATVAIGTDVTNTSSASASASVASEVLDPNDQVVASASSVQELAISTSRSFTHTIRLPAAMLWSPEHPHLYRLRTTVRVNDKVADQVLTSFGVRQIRFDPERGLFVNGRPFKLQGVNLHQDHAGVGVAVPDRLFTWRLERLKEMGCNAIRLSHNPVAPFLLDECDRLGFLVIAENRHLGDTFADQAPKETRALAHRDLSALVTRDRNHPSIFLWSLCNEQWIQGTPEAAAMAQAMKQRVHELDPTRPVTAAMNGGFDSAAGLGAALDVIGLNYNPDVYDSVHALFPKTPIVASEIASEIGTRGIYRTDSWETYFGDRERGYVAAYSITAGPAGQTVENAWPPVVARDFVAGGFVWAGFDYKGEPRPFGWPVVNCHYGFMDLCGFPKDSYYYYKAWWTLEPVLHLFPHWNWPDRMGAEIPVWVHSNCAAVELFLNGASLGRQTTQALRHHEWKVKYTPGTLSAKGFDAAGKVVAETTIETTGPAAMLQLTPDRRRIDADGEDIAVFTVSAQDAQGRLVPVAQNQIRFALAGAGRIIGVGNGDPSSHEPDTFAADNPRPAPVVWSRSLFNGLAQIIVQSTHDAGEFTLTATADGLRPASTSVQTQPCTPRPSAP